MKKVLYNPKEDRVIIDLSGKLSIEGYQELLLGDGEEYEIDDKMLRKKVLKVQEETPVERLIREKMREIAIRELKREGKI